MNSAASDGHVGDGSTKSIPRAVAVIGSGIMGRGIARLFASAGAAVRLHNSSDVELQQGLAALSSDLDRSIGRSNLTIDDKADLLGRIEPTTSLSTAANNVDLVIEAVPEDIDLKCSLFEQLDRCAPQGAILASNTSALSITRIAGATTRPERVLGLHFFNPVHRIDLVELVVALQTHRDTVVAARDFCRSVGRTTVEVTDRPGFVTSRINAMIGNEAFHMLEEGLATAEDIDIALKLGLKHPMGPFELVDLVGLDTRLSVLRRLHAGLGDKFRPSPLLVSLVEAGRLGRKTGRGVYRYDISGNRIVQESQDA